MLIGEIPDPDRTVTDHHLSLGPAPATPPGFGIESKTEGLRSLDGGDVGCGFSVAHGPTLRIGRGLGENPAQLHFARVPWLAVQLARAAFRLGLHHRYTG